MGIDRRKDKENPEYQKIKKGNIPNAPARTKQLLGIYKHRENGVDTDEYSKMYDRSKYIFMLDAKFACSDMCCKVMKKAPAHEYGKRTGRKAITAQMASESKLRTTQWIKNGCNGFDMKTPISNPMSFWTEQDVLLYIKLYGKDIVKRKINNNSDVMFYGNRIVDCKIGKTIEEQEFYNTICSVYGDVVIDPCCGSGSTLRAAAEIGRSAFGFEIDRNFYQRAKNEMIVFERDNQISFEDILGVMP